MEVLGCVGAIIVWIAAVILRGWVLTVMWGWFMVPVFNAPSISIAAGLGISMIVSFLTSEHKPATKSETPKSEAWLRLAEQLVFAILYPLLTLAVGYIVQLFM